MATNTKLASLQVVRALAAWAVVFHHYVQLYLNPKSATGVAAFFWTYGSLGVDVFFVLSGFVMCLVAQKSTMGPIAFLIDRAFRIAPAYWFFSTVVIACIYMFPAGFSYTAFNVESLIRSAAFIPGQNPSGLGTYPVLTVGWTLNFEMFFYIALACCMAVSRRWFLAIFFVVFALLPIAYPYSAPLSVIARDARLYEFWVGVALAVVWTYTLAGRVRNFPVFAFVLGLAFVLSGVGLLLLRGTATLFALSIVAFALVCEQHLRRQTFALRALVHLGDISYSTYLVHCIVIGIAIHFSGKGLPPAHQLALLLTSVGATYAASLMSYRWVENSKYVAAARKAAIRLIRPNDSAQVAAR